MEHAIVVVVCIFRAHSREIDILRNLVQVLFPPWGNETTTPSSTATSSTDSDIPAITVLHWNVSTPATIVQTDSSVDSVSTAEADSTADNTTQGSISVNSTVLDVTPSTGTTDMSATDISLAMVSSTTSQTPPITIRGVDSGVVVVESDSGSNGIMYVIVAVLSFAVIVLFIALRKVRKQPPSTVGDADNKAEVAASNNSPPTSTSAWVATTYTTVGRPGLLPPVRYPSGRKYVVASDAPDVSRSDVFAERFVASHTHAASPRVHGTTGQTGGMPHRVVRLPEAVYTAVPDAALDRRVEAELPGAVATSPHPHTDLDQSYSFV